MSAKFGTAEELTQKIIGLYAAGKFDKAYAIYSQFKNVMTQVPTAQQMVPFVISEKLLHTLQNQQNGLTTLDNVSGIYSFEPDANALLERLVPQQIAAQIYSVLLEVAAGEQAARMAAMDNATRNAGDMINRLTLQYNRARQAYITKEVSEIVAGAEASA
jgi:F-type H+-transporting ATPase subunit gamma